MAKNNKRIKRPNKQTNKAAAESASKQDEVEQAKAGQAEVEQAETRQVDAGQAKVKQTEVEQTDTKQTEANQAEAKQAKTKQTKAAQSQTATDTHDAKKDDEPFVLSSGKIGSNLPTGSNSSKKKKQGKASNTKSKKKPESATKKAAAKRTHAALSNQIATKVFAVIILIFLLGWGFHVGPFAEEETYNYGQLNKYVDAVDSLLCANRTTIVPCDEDGNPVTEWKLHYVQIGSDGKPVDGTEQLVESTAENPIEGFRFNQSANGVETKAEKGTYTFVFEYADKSGVTRWHGMTVEYADSDKATIGKVYATYDPSLKNEIDISVFTEHLVSAEAPE